MQGREQQKREEEEQWRLQEEAEQKKQEEELHQKREWAEAKKKCKEEECKAKEEKKKAEELKQQEELQKIREKRFSRAGQEMATLPGSRVSTKNASLGPSDPNKKSKGEYRGRKPASKATVRNALDLDSRDPTGGDNRGDLLRLEDDKAGEKGACERCRNKGDPNNCIPLDVDEFPNATVCKLYRRSKQPCSWNQRKGRGRRRVTKPRDKKGKKLESVASAESELHPTQMDKQLTHLEQQIERMEQNIRRLLELAEGKGKEKEKVDEKEEEEEEEDEQLEQQSSMYIVNKILVVHF
ncbi:hypothetical protein GYMLUDRAFT_57659 [Collybiopsis luxurians FD-317 M1]|uniref:Uncharacterized protein n=1 Tax=Collybiopsis luxurians FD-317 M1 TaxID=944289 RepID=A0A0D0C5R6_9AGAR|nr:hypothetical protein GYMLUDRAFT_57659 [Collybiopsis luxurians FD-317 M1]